MAIYKSIGEITVVLIENIKKLAQRSQTIVKLYSKWSFIRRVPIKDFLQPNKIRLLLTVQPYTLVSYPKLSKLYEAASLLERAGISGSFVECGVWNGGSAGVVAAVLKHNKNRHVWLFDSWEGLPEPGEYDITYAGERGEKGRGLGSEEKVRKLAFKKLKLDPKRIRLVKGWFNDTLPVHKDGIGKIALLHLDCDWYESVKFCLEELYDNVSREGFIFIDDYGYWLGSNKAVDEFIAERKLSIKLIKTYHTGVYFQKS